VTLEVDISYHGDQRSLPAFARRAEEAGVAGLFVPEGQHDPFISLTLASTTTSHIRLGTGVAIAFARTPMSLAYSGYHLHRVTDGRTVLGLGPQIKPHITYRFGMPWSRPADRMREYVLALRAIWNTWQTGEALDFRGEFYTHTLMPPLFSPGPLQFPSPPIWLAAVGPRMLDVAASVADGLLCHPLISASYLRDVIRPAVTSSRTEGSAAFGMASMVMVTTGRTEEEFASAIAGTRQQIGFYASTPSYLPVLEHHGWTALHEEARALTKQGRWAELCDLIDDEVLNTFAVVGAIGAVRAALGDRFDGLLDRATLSMPYPASAEIGLAVARS
jgi:probable F420-dependent oxidoreductase